MGSPKLRTKVLRWIFGRMKVQAISILCIITIQGFALISGDECQDRISFGRCERIAARDKCDKPWAAKKCAETCGYCDEDYCGDVFPTKKCERWNKRGKCNWAVAQFLCKKTCGYCENDEDTPTTMAPPEPTTGSPTNPPTGGPDPPSPTDGPPTLHQQKYLQLMHLTHQQQPQKHRGQPPPQKYPTFQMLLPVHLPVVVNVETHPRDFKPTLSRKITNKDVSQSSIPLAGKMKSCLSCSLQTVTLRTGCRV